MEFLADSIGLVNVDGGGGHGNEATIISLLDPDTNETVLAKHVETKRMGEGNVFTGWVDALTGELKRGSMIYQMTNEVYEGPFQQNLRHGGGAVCKKLDGSSKFIGTFRNDVFYEGTLITSESTYTGFFVNNKPEGHGQMAMSNGDVYKGDFQKGYYHGIGHFITHDYDFSGQFVLGRKEGAGRSTHSDGKTYVGEWINDMKQGNGIETYPGTNEERYEGQFWRNMRHGIGTMKRAQVVMTGPWHRGKHVDGKGWKIQYPSVGLEYEGSTFGCRPHGWGTMIAHDSENGFAIEYEGNFVWPGLRHGEGRIVRPSWLTSAPRWRGELPALDQAEGSQNIQKTAPTSHPKNDAAPGEVTGEIVDEIEPVDNEYLDTFQGNTDAQGRRQGYGVHKQVVWKTTYEGEWKDSLRCGKGRIVLGLFGIEYSGMFERNAFQGKGELRLPDGSRYIGDFQDGMIHGEGTFEDKTLGFSYSGFFLNGRKNGKGLERFDHDKVFQGDFKDGHKHGKGKLVRVVKGEEQPLFEGDWKEDNMTGKGKMFGVKCPCPGVYDGDVEGGLCHGHGAYATDHGYVLEGNWSRGTPIDGDWSIVGPCGSSYYGGATYETGLELPVPHGFGSQNEVNGDFYSGFFTNGRRHGTGMAVFANGERWDGRWEHGTFVKYGRERP